MQTKPTIKRASELLVTRYTQQRAALHAGECERAAALGDEAFGALETLGQFRPRTPAEIRHVARALRVLFQGEREITDYPAAEAPLRALLDSIEALGEPVLRQDCGPVLGHNATR